MCTHYHLRVFLLLITFFQYLLGCFEIFVQEVLVTRYFLCSQLSSSSCEGSAASFNIQRKQRKGKHILHQTVRVRGCGWKCYLLCNIENTETHYNNTTILQVKQHPIEFYSLVYALYIKTTITLNQFILLKQPVCMS